MIWHIIIKGDTTTHGGKVLEGFSDETVQDIPVAGVGHMVSCPKYKGIFPIVNGYSGWTVNGVPVAVHGNMTACGASLISSQNEMVIDDGELEQQPPAPPPLPPAPIEQPETSTFWNDLKGLVGIKKEKQTIRFFFAHKETQEPYADTPYTATLPDGETVRGVTDQNGYTENFAHVDGGEVSVHLHLAKEKRIIRNKEDMS